MHMREKGVIEFGWAFFTGLRWIAPDFTRSCADEVALPLTV